MSVFETGASCAQGRSQYHEGRLQRLVWPLGSTLVAAGTGVSQPGAEVKQIPSQVMFESQSHA